MEAEQIKYHKNVIAKFEEILSRYSIEENNELHTIAFDVKQSHAVLLSEVAPKQEETLLKANVTIDLAKKHLKDIPERTDILKADLIKVIRVAEEALAKSAPKQEQEETCEDCKGTGWETDDYSGSSMCHCNPYSSKAID